MLFSSHRRRMVSSPALGRVIVADPDDASYAMVRQLTAPDCWEVRYAGTPDELREALRGPAARLALVNLSLVDEEMMEELTERSRRGLRVVITTDEHSETNERRARLLGPVFYAPKPVHVTLLSEVLDGALNVAV